MNKIFAVSIATSMTCGPAFAELKTLNGEEIAALLPTIIALSPQSRQTFSAAGPTTYTDRGRDTFGSWRVQGDKYCSEWPPAGGWSCYGVEYDAETARLIWIDGGGHRTVNTVQPKN
ncbi:MAG: hypothetical protein HRU27_04305 [Rhizobiaceae bacterium]|nr:hypothetical protein [Hyphomicrobiales bacterium]NRB29800.1 hypothetical protein [Rhizobiaceae bacterium]